MQLDPMPTAQIREVVDLLYKEGRQTVALLLTDLDVLASNIAPRCIHSSRVHFGNEKNIKEIIHSI
jgi:hypothetical protein